MMCIYISSEIICIFSDEADRDKSIHKTVSCVNAFTIIVRISAQNNNLMRNTTKKRQIIK